MKIGALIPVLNEWRFVPAVVGQVLKVADRCVIVRGKRSFSGAPAEISPVPKLDPRVEILEGSWRVEHEIRNAGIRVLSDCDYVISIDSDEILLDDALEKIVSAFEKSIRVLVCQSYKYWKSPSYRIDPPEFLYIPVGVHKDVRFRDIRKPTEGVVITDQRLIHHLAYVRTDDEMREKIRLSGHAAEFIPGWFENVWKAWDTNRSLENLHPTFPEIFKRAVYDPDRELNETLRKYGVQPW